MPPETMDGPRRMIVPELGWKMIHHHHGSEETGKHVTSVPCTIQDLILLHFEVFHCAGVVAEAHLGTQVLKNRYSDAIPTTRGR